MSTNPIAPTSGALAAVEDNEERTYFLIPTNTGKAKLTAALALKQSVDITHIAVGDGAGEAYEPDKTMTALRREVWRGEVNRKVVHPEDPNIIIIVGIIPPDVGGFFVREVGIFDDAGDLLFVGAHPSSYKPTPGSGISKDMILEEWIIVEEAGVLELTADLNVVGATIMDLQLLDEKYTPEIGAVDLINSKQYPFNDSAQTISLSIVRDNLDYTIHTEVTGSDGMAGDVEVFDKQLNGFKIRFTGSATQLAVKYYVRGGLNR